MRYAVGELADFARQVMQEIQQRRGKVFAEHSTEARKPKARQSPKVDELKGELQKMANQVDALKQIATLLDSEPLKQLEAAQKEGARKGGRASAEARRVGTQGPSPTPAEPPPPPEPSTQPPPPPAEEGEVRPAAADPSPTAEGRVAADDLRSAGGL